MQIIGGWNNTLVNYQWVIEEIREEIKSFLEADENEKHHLPESMGHSKGSPKRKVNSHDCIY
jgi:hypothetical protein